MNNDIRRIGLFSIIPVLAILCAIFIYYLPITSKTMLDPAKNKNILLVALPKSGSTYITKMFQENLKYTYVALLSMSTANLNDPTNLTPEFFFQTPFRLIAKEHYSPTETTGNNYDLLSRNFLNIPELKKYTHKILVHVRDPRQALLSWLHHLDLHFDEIARQGVQLPVNYHRLSLSAKIDWGIENILPGNVNWVKSWLELKKKEEQSSSNGLKILLTTYDELLEDEVTLFGKMTAFYGISFDRNNFKKINKNAEVRFRKGEPEEWRTVFTEEQKKRVAEIVPDDLLKHFNWKL